VNKKMIIIGIVDTPQEAKELQFIGRVVVLENRIHELLGIAKYENGTLGV